MLSDNNVPRDFNILELVKRNMFKSKLKFNHGRRIREEIPGEVAWNQEYVKMINYFGAGYALMAWYGWIADYLHAFQILNVVELSNDGTQYKPLEASLKDAANLSIANT